jgi:hypothetical protein
VPLESLLPLEEYRDVIRGCDIVILNHWRQQAVGNVIAALNAGSRVVFDRRNPCSPSVSSRDSRCSPWRNLGRPDFWENPPSVDGESQRQAILRIWGEAVVTQNFRVAVETMDQVRLARARVRRTTRP